MKTYRAAVIGCGLIGSRFASDVERIGVYTHAGAYSISSRIHLCGLCDADPAALAEAANRWGVMNCFTNPRQLLDECRPDIVSVCTPDATHAVLLADVLNYPTVRAVFAEKPLATDLAGARDVLSRAGAKPLLVNYARRFASNHQALKAEIDAHAIGRVVAVQGLYTKGLRHNGTHWIDLARWLVGEVAVVQAFDVLREGGEDPTVDVRLGFDGGATGALTGLAAAHYAAFEMDLLGTAGRARITDAGWTIEIAGVGASPRYSGYRSLGVPTLVGGDMRDVARRAVENLVSHLDDPSLPLACTGEDGLRGLLVVDAAERSLKSGRVETVAAL